MLEDWGGLRHAELEILRPLGAVAGARERGPDLDAGRVQLGPYGGGQTPAGASGIVLLRHPESAPAEESAVCLETKNIPPRPHRFGC